jgi:hypothetical protein
MYSTNLEDYLPYRALWLSVLLQAVRDIDDRDASLSRRAWDWINGGEKTPQSFQWICAVLDLCPFTIQIRCTSRQGRWEMIGTQYLRYMQRRESEEEA